MHHLFGPECKRPGYYVHVSRKLKAEKNREVSVSQGSPEKRTNNVFVCVYIYLHIYIYICIRFIFRNWLIYFRGLPNLKYV